MKQVVTDLFIDGYIAQGEARGKRAEAARLLLRCLNSKFDVPDEHREQVTSCTDRIVLEAWFDLALTAKTLDEVFADEKALEDRIKLICRELYREAVIAGEIARGEAKGASTLLLRLLESKFDLSDGLREHITNCANVDRLEAWFDRALTAKTLNKVFAD
jgi:hypothetical protein